MPTQTATVVELKKTARQAPTAKLDQLIEQNIRLQEHCGNLQQNNQSLQAKYQRLGDKSLRLKQGYLNNIQRISEQSEQIDSLSNALCEKSLELNELKQQLSIEHEQYERLMAEYTQLQAQQDLQRRGSWLIDRIDRLQDKLGQLKNDMAKAKSLRFRELAKATLERLLTRPKLRRFLNTLPRLTNNSKQEENSSKAAPMARWMALNKVMPLETGMYRVSDGQQSAFAYYDGKSHLFTEQAFTIRYWQLEA